MILTEQQRKLAEQLLISVINREAYVEYNELANRITPPMFHRQVGKEIGKVSELCHELGLPLLSAKVVSKGQLKAGDGFFELMKQLGRYDYTVPEKEQFRNELKAIRECTEWHKLADYLNLDLSFPSSETSAPEKEADLRMHNSVFADEVVADDGTEFIEGSIKQVTINAYERNPAAREKCIAIHGAKCTVCGFDFSLFYGKEFEGLIHVHHLKPLHTLGKEYAVNPETDLIPVCPNCHLALHSKPDGVYSPEELNKKIKAADK